MGKSGKQPWANWEKRRDVRDLHSTPNSRRSLFFGRILRASLAVILAAGLLPLLPVAPIVEEAEGLEGTTNYDDFFNVKNRSGSPASISGNRLRAASTVRTSDYGWYNGDRWMSGGAFVSKAPVSLDYSWEAQLQAYLATPNAGASHNSIGSNIQLGLSTNPNPNQASGLIGATSWQYRASGGLQAPTVLMNQMAGGIVTGTLADGGTLGNASSIPISLLYDATADTLTFSASGRRVSYPNIRSYFGSASVYLFLQSSITWRNATETGTTVAHANAPANMTNNLDFNSLTLPYLDLDLRSIVVSEAATDKILQPTDVVPAGTVLKIDCTVRNSSPRAGTEKYSTSLKMTGPTQNITPIVSTAYPVTSGGSLVTTTKNGNTVDGANGVPVTLIGSQDTHVIYYAQVDQSDGRAVKLSHVLEENVFKGRTAVKTAVLFNERPLKPGDGSGSGAAGHDYHYTRLPAPNANGWNTSPVTVTFYPGDFDQMTLTPSEGAAKVLTGDDPAWMRSDDTAGVSLSAQAKDTESGAVSTQRAGLVKIDTSAPRIEGGGALGYTLTDVPADASKATSGIWRLHRTDSSGGAVAAAARAAATREFPLTNGDGTPTQAVGKLPNGWYVAEDAAGNLSAPLKVSSTEPPSVERPAGSQVDPGDPGYAPPVGPPLGPGSDPVPAPAVKEDGEGLRHALIEESVSQMIDPAAPPFGGLLEPAEATALMDYRYAASSTAAPTTTVDTLLGADGNPLASFDTKVPGECTVKRVIADAQGNTTTILLHYRTVRDSCPPVRPLQPSDPADPDSPKVPGDPLVPTGPVATRPDGTQHVEVACDVTEAVTHGTMDAAGAEALFKRHFAATDVDGGDGVTLTVQSMKNSSGGGYLLH